MNNEYTKNNRTFTYQLIFVIGLGLLVYTYRFLIGPLLIAGLLAYLLYPLMNWLQQKTRLQRTTIVIVVFSIFLITIITLMRFLVPVVVSQSRFVTREFNNVQQEIKNVSLNLEAQFGVQIPMDQWMNEFQSDINQFLQSKRVFQVLQSVTTNIVWVLVVLAASFYLLQDWPRLREWVFNLVPSEHLADARCLHDEIKDVWRRYLRGQLLMMFIVGSLSGICAAALGLPGAVLIGMLAGVLVIIPNLGPAVATLIAGLLAWVEGSRYLDIPNFWFAVLICGCFMGIQFIEGIWLQPQIMGRRMHLHPGLIFLTVIGTLTMVGATATLIVIPLLASVDIILKFARQKREGLDPWSEVDHGMIDVAASE